jgi:hypothetical protein
VPPKHCTPLQRSIWPIDHIIAVFIIADIILERLEHGGHERTRGPLKLLKKLQ